MNSSNNTKSNFGKWGWSMILYCAVSYYLAAALSTDTLNWFPSAFTAYHGWDASIVNLCNAMAGIGGWLGVIAAVVFSIMAAKWGSRFMAVLGNFVCGVLCIIFACTTNITVFLAMVVILTFVSGNIQLNVVPNNIMNIWFPKKKGLALGWASMGLPLCTATIIVILSAIGNPKTAYIILGILCFAVGIISIFWVKNTPEEVGATPDNEPIDHEEALALKAKQEEEAKHMTIGMIAKNRNTWLIGFGHGFLWINYHWTGIKLYSTVAYGGYRSECRFKYADDCCPDRYFWKLCVGMAGSEVDHKDGIYYLWFLVFSRITDYDFPQWFHGHDNFSRHLCGIWHWRKSET